ncbi:hypothetical protein DFJ77DRAFT_446810 [Powellomyces hirtus]|nr:hypothetical protein DFJ77DRAFT_446810 [Powellomyces hirtus]
MSVPTESDHLSERAASAQPESTPTRPTLAIATAAASAVPFRVHARTTSLDATNRARNPSPLCQLPASAINATSSPVTPRPKSSEVDANEINDTNVIVSILEEERAKGSVSLNLSDRHLTALPPDIGQLVLLERLGLSNNLLTSLPMEIMGLAHLRYLNLRSNQIREFPMSICRLPTLEILDISRNKLKRLPASFGNLINLKVLSLARNRLQQLPQYVGSMTHLKVLKIEHNPLQWPPPEVLQNPTDVPHETWVQTFKEFLLAENPYPEPPDSKSKREGLSIATDRLKYSESIATPSSARSRYTFTDYEPTAAFNSDASLASGTKNDCCSHIQNHLRHKRQNPASHLRSRDGRHASAETMESLAYALSKLYSATSSLLMELNDASGGNERILVDICANVDDLNNTTIALISLVSSVQHQHQPFSSHSDSSLFDYTTPDDLSTTATTPPATTSAMRSVATSALHSASQLVRAIRASTDPLIQSLDVRITRTLLSDWYLANVELADAMRTFETLVDPPPDSRRTLTGLPATHAATQSNASRPASPLAQPPTIRDIAKNAAGAASHILVLLKNVPQDIVAANPAEHPNEQATQQQPTLAAAGALAKELLDSMHHVQDCTKRISDALPPLDSPATADIKAQRKVAEESSHFIKVPIFAFVPFMSVLGC